VELAAEPRPWQRIFPPRCELHQIVHGEEIGLVSQFRDQREFVLDESPHVLRHSLRPASARALHSELAQPSCSVLARRHQLLRVLIAQLIERKLAALGNTLGFLE
jgi:hypothetical protein